MLIVLATKESNNNKNTKKKLYKRPAFWVIGIIVLSLVGAVLYRTVLGGPIGVAEHKRQLHNDIKIAKTNFQIKHTFHDSSMVSAETVIDDLQNHFNTHDLSSVSYTKIYNYVMSKYGQIKGNLIMNGKIVSANMTPFQSAETEIEIARTLGVSNTMVGLPQTNVDNNIINNNIKTKVNTVNLGDTYTPSAVTWITVDNHEISSPTYLECSISQIGATSQLINNLSNPLSASPVIIWIKANKGDTFKDIRNVATKINIKAGGNRLNYAYTRYNNEQLSNIQNKYKEWTLANFYVNNFSLKNNTKVFNNSLIPVMFQLKDSTAKSLGSQYSLNLIVNNHSYMMFANNTMNLN